MAWLLAAVVFAVGVESVLTGDLLWGVFAALVGATMALPAVATRTWAAMPPWPLVLTATLAVLSRSNDFYPELAGYVVVATAALILVVELDLYTGVEFTRRFAVVFAVMTTMAVQAVWTVTQYYSDQWLNTSYLTTQTDLQWDFVAVTTTALLLGLGFTLLLRRFGSMRTGEPVEERSA